MSSDNFKIYLSGLPPPSLYGVKAEWYQETFADEFFFSLLPQLMSLEYHHMYQFLLIGSGPTDVNNLGDLGSSKHCVEFAPDVKHWTLKE